MKTNEKTPLVEVRNFKKHFGGIKAVDNVSFKIYEGESIGLVGDNGAGKSTLIKAISGIQPPDEGEFFLNGQKISNINTQVMGNIGVEVCYQDLCLAETVDVPGNIFLGREIKRKALGILPIMDFNAMKKEAKNLLSNLEIKIEDFSSPVGSLSGGQRKSVAISRTLLEDKPGIIIFDEPCASLGVREMEKVLNLLEKLRDQGQTMVTISHDLEHVFRFSDRIICMKQGKVVDIKDTNKTSKKEIVELMC